MEGVVCDGGCCGVLQDVGVQRRGLTCDGGF